MPDLANRQVREVLAALASREEPPAAGVASALAGAAAAALVELSAALASTRLAAAGEEGSGRMAEVAERAGELRVRMLGAADDDVRAYADVTGAPDGAARTAGLSRASDPPLVIAECASEVAQLAAETVRAGDWDFRADAVVASQLASAVAASSAELVATNLAGDPEDSRTDRARAAGDRAQRATRAAAERIRA